MLLINSEREQGITTKSNQTACNKVASVLSPLIEKGVVVVFGQENS